MTTRRITTTDNPFDPFDQWDEWYAFDERAGYSTCGLIARFTSSSDELSELEESEAIDRAIDEIVFENYLGPYKIVTREI